MTPHLLICAGLWLEVLAALMTALGVPHRVVADGGLVRQKGQERIAFLAAARNAALEPLWASAHSVRPGNSTGAAAAQRTAAGQPSRYLRAMSEYDSAARANGSGASTLRLVQQVSASSAGAQASTEAASRAQRASQARKQRHHHARVLLDQPARQNATAETVMAASRVWRGGDDEAPFRADRVLFLNDVFFCAAGAARLLRHDADLACGMDFDRPAIRQMSRQVRSAVLYLGDTVCVVKSPQCLRAAQSAWALHNRIERHVKFAQQVGTCRHMITLMCCPGWRGTPFSSTQQHHWTIIMHNRTNLQRHCTTIVMQTMRTNVLNEWIAAGPAATVRGAPARRVRRPGSRWPCPRPLDGPPQTVARRPGHGRGAPGVRAAAVLRHLGGARRCRRPVRQDGAVCHVSGLSGACPPA